MVTDYFKQYSTIFINDEPNVNDYFFKNMLAQVRPCVYFNPTKKNGLSSAT